ncbi:MAG: hypothetical protein AVDCRST_MAG27-3788, partial [uncultured Craurococcus sp.]
ASRSLLSAFRDVRCPSAALPRKACEASGIDRKACPRDAAPRWREAFL